MSNLHPEISAVIPSDAERFLNVLDKNHDTRMMIDGIRDGFTFQTFADKKDNKDPRLTSVLHGEYVDLKARLRALNNAGAGIFVTINETDMVGRKASNITRVRAVWIDDDGYAEMLYGVPKAEPNLVTETSPGKFHKIFLVDGATFEDHKRLQEILVERWGSDKGAKDIARVLRVPGFRHNKGEPFMARLIHESGAEPYKVEELAALLGGWVTPEPVKKVYQEEPTPAPVEVDENGCLPITADPDYVLPDITIKKAKKYLPKEHNLSREEWLRVGLALFNQFQGSNEAMLLFNEWSSTVREYKGVDDIQVTWDSFRGRTIGPKISFKYLVKESNRIKLKTSEEAKIALKEEKETDQSPELSFDQEVPEPVDLATELGVKVDMFVESCLDAVKTCRDIVSLRHTISPLLEQAAGKDKKLWELFKRTISARVLELAGCSVTQAPAIQTPVTTKSCGAAVAMPLEMDTQYADDEDDYLLSSMPLSPAPVYPPAVIEASQEIDTTGNNDPGIYDPFGNPYSETARTIIGYFDFATEWAWVSSESKFVNLRDMSVSVTKVGFDGRFNGNLKRLENIKQKSMSDFLLGNNAILKVDRLIYAPNSPKVFEYPSGSGVLALNIYVDSGAQIPKEIPEEGRTAAEALRRHIELTAGGWNKEAILLCNFLATCIEKPYVKMPWAMLLTGEEGTGKSFLGELLSKALGYANTKQISGNVIAGGSKSGFNGWAEGHLMGIVEEVKWHGESRFDILNNLKPVITNPTISCHKKGKDPYNIPNFANYILFSNHSDALHLTSGDRRYCILRSEFPLDDMKKNDPGYFKRLFGYINSEHVGSMLRFLIDVPKHEEFTTTGAAPSTNEKDITILSVDDGVGDYIGNILSDEIEKYRKLDSELEGGIYHRANGVLLRHKDHSYTVEPNARIDFSYVCARVAIEMGDQSSSSVAHLEKRLKEYLVKKGYIQVSRRRIKGKAHSIWGLRNRKESENMREIVTQDFVTAMNKESLSTEI